MLKETKDQFQKEQDEILKTILNRRYFYPWKEKYQKIENEEEYNPEYSLADSGVLEIFLTSTCNQKCEYCYLVKNPGLYPKEINNKELILKNLKILFDYIIENKYYISEIEYFSGEIWHNSFGLEVLEITYEAIQNGLAANFVTIPSNCSFILDKEQTKKIQDYIDKFNEINVRVMFSISVDGKIIEEDTRPLNSKQIRTDEFYENLFAFAKRNTYYFHPMVASCSAHKWIENYQWWEDMCNKYGYNVDEAVMFLEVRNNDWTEESIDHYNNFMKHLIDKHVRNLGSVEAFARHAFSMTNENDIEYQMGGYVPFCFAPSFTFAGCTVSDSLTVRVGDLAICPCHRTAYNKYLYGHFVVENDKIVDITANNPQMAIRILMANNNLCHHGCDNCIYSPYCLKGCFGSQIEVTNDPFFPIENVCHFFKRKFKFLVNYYEEIGVFDYLRKELNPYSPYFLSISKVLKFAKEVQEDESVE